MKVVYTPAAVRQIEDPLACLVSQGALRAAVAARAHHCIRHRFSCRLSQNGAVFAAEDSEP
jgi:hypothetical protein